MPSPFPGMNPYLEQSAVWHDFHNRAIPVIAELIAAQAEPDHVVKIDEHVYVHELGTETRHFIGRADVTAAEMPSRSDTQTAAATATLEAPARVVFADADMDVERISFVEVRDRRNWRLITLIELLSPSNKHNGPDREQYLAKRRREIATAVNLVEIDLLRGGPRMPFKNLPVSDYYALVSRYGERPSAEIWPFQMRDPLPRIPIPLRSSERDAVLDLRAVLDRVYDAARYENWIYQSDPDPDLSEADQAWAAAILSGPTRS